MTDPVRRLPRRLALAAAAVGLVAAAGLGVSRLGTGPASPLSAPSASPKGSDQAAHQASVEAAVRDWHAEAGVPGVVAAVQRGHAPPVVVAWGDADPGGRWPISEEHRFRIGSITKTFVAAVVLQLAEEGRLDLDASAARWVPGLGNRSGITVRHLLGHRSGLAEAREQDAFIAATRPRLADPWTPQEVIGFALDAPAEFAPGSAYAYRGTNYLVLGLIVEAVTGRPLPDVIDQRLLQPLRLASTELPDATEEPAGLAVGRSTVWADLFDMDAIDTTTVPYQAIQSAAWAEGSMVSDARDLLRWGRALYREDVLSARMREAMTTADAESGYGLGSYAADTPSGRAVGHGGIYFGFRAELRHLPEHDMTVVALANGDGADVAALVDALAAVIMEGDTAPAADGLRAADATARERAVLALGRRPDPDADAVRRLTAVLRDDPSPRVRAAAALALGFAGRADEEVAHGALRQAERDDPAEEVRAAARRALSVLRGTGEGRG